jgi:predicted membrane channel-forming protein YqfA (hemolysin III family)
MMARAGAGFSLSPSEGRGPALAALGDAHVQWNFGDILLTMLALFFWAALIWMFIGAFADIFRRTDLSGVGKAGWMLLIVILPLLGVLVYVIARPAGAVMDLPPARGHADPGSSQVSPADEIEKARLLLTSGAITPEEFATIKEHALARAAGN